MLDRQRLRGLDEPGEAVRPVVAAAGHEPRVPVTELEHRPVAIELDLVQPPFAGGGVVGERGEREPGKVA